MACLAETPGGDETHLPHLLKKQLLDCHHSYLQTESVFLQEKFCVQTAAGLSDRGQGLEGCVPGTKVTGPAAPPSLWGRERGPE